MNEAFLHEHCLHQAKTIALVYFDSKIAEQVKEVSFYYNIILIKRRIVASAISVAQFIQICKKELTFSQNGIFFLAPYAKAERACSLTLSN